MAAIGPYVSATSTRYHSSCDGSADSTWHIYYLVLYYVVCPISLVLRITLITYMVYGVLSRKAQLFYVDL